LFHSVAHGMVTSINKDSMSERRSDVKIMVDILNVALKGAKKTEIVYKVNLNFKQVRKYLDFLMKKELIAVCDFSTGKDGYKTTEKGKNFAKRYRETIQLIA
jgi:predicted transcriptional regulator